MGSRHLHQTPKINPMEILDRDFADQSRNCSICESNEIFYSHDSDGLQFFLCELCGHAFANPPLTEGTLSGYYEGSYWKNRERPLWVQFGKTVQRVPKFIQAMWRVPLPFPKRNPKILEIGSGLGGIVWSLSYILRGKGYCVEPDSGFRTFSSHLGVTPIEIGTDSDGQFDLVVLSHVLEHQNQPYLLIEKAMRSLSSGGMMIVEVPNSAAGDRGGIHHPMIFSKESFFRLCSSVASEGFFFTHGKSEKRGVREKYLLAVLAPPASGAGDSQAESVADRGGVTKFLPLPDGVLWRIFRRRLLHFLLAGAKRKTVGFEP